MGFVDRVEGVQELYEGLRALAPLVVDAALLGGERSSSRLLEGVRREDAQEHGLVRLQHDLLDALGRAGRDVVIVGRLALDDDPEAQDPGDVFPAGEATRDEREFEGPGDLCVEDVSVREAPFEDSIVTFTKSLN